MSRSILLQLARDSIQEVLEAQRTIDKEALVSTHPLLNEKITTTINLYLDQDLRGSSSSTQIARTLLDDIIYNAKKAAFEDKNFTPITTSEYLSCKVEIILNTPNGAINEIDPAILSSSTS